MIDANVQNMASVNHALRRYHVSIMDIGAALAKLGSVSNQIGPQIDTAVVAGVAIGLRRAAYRIEHDGIDGFDLELLVAAAVKLALSQGKTPEQIVVAICGDSQGAALIKQLR